MEYKNWIGEKLISEEPETGTKRKKRNEEKKELTLKVKKKFAFNFCMKIFVFNYCKEFSKNASIFYLGPNFIFLYFIFTINF